MIRTNILFYFLLSINILGAQTMVYRDTVPVFSANSKMLSPWAGGLNYCSFNQMDLNGDGLLDLIAYDKICSSGGKIRTFLNVGSPGVAKYIHEFNFQNLFPEINYWMYLYDYNNDGKVDIYTWTLGGIKVYKNESVGQHLTFTLVKPLLMTNYNPSGPPSIANLYATQLSPPAISDIDNDGDLDILTYNVSGYRIELHKNMSQELYSHSDSLVFNMVDDCWGDMQESSCQVDTGVCPLNFIYKNTIYNGNSTNNINNRHLNKVTHSGACIMCFDRDGDGDKDVILGDIACNGITYVENVGSANNAHVGDTTKLFPNYPNKASTDVIKMSSFPCTYYLDVDNDGFKDLIASPNASAGAENYQSVWYYNNASATPTVNFVIQKKNFLQEDMIEMGEGAYPVLFDADLDGKQDLIIGNMGYFEINALKSKLTYYKNIGTTSAPSYSFITNDYQSLSTYSINGMAPTFGDLDNDGDKDLIIGNNIGTLDYFENTAAIGTPAQFTNRVSFYKSIDIGNNAYPQLFDINKDGKLDLLIGNANGKLSYYLNTGTLSNPAFILQSSFFGEVDVRVNGSITGYSTPFMYRDAGITKLIVGSEIGNLYYYDNIDGNLTGHFNRVDTNMYKINEGPRCAPFFEDITTDGKRDLFLGNYAGGLGFFNSTNVGGVGIEEILTSENVIIYPNPTSDKFTIELKDHSLAEINMKCYDVLGNKVFELNTFNQVIQIDASQLSKGLYFIQFQSTNQQQIKTITKKVVVQ